MKNEKLFNAIGYIDDELVERGANRAALHIAAHRRPYKRVLVAVIAAVLMLALSITAMAYSGLLGWIFIDRDLDTKNRSEMAREVVGEFAGIIQEQEAEATNQTEPGAEDNDNPESMANGAVNWFAGQIKQHSLTDIKISDYAGELDDGTIAFYFSPGDNPLFERSIIVSISPDGMIHGIDFRAAITYPQPENCPQEYIQRMTHLSSGIVEDFFNSDTYLMEVAYPDTTAYAPEAEAAAAKAMGLLSENGFVSAHPDTIELVYFEMFNGGAAWVDVLMENGDVYCLYLQPDDFSILGFALLTKENLSAGNGNAALFEALRKGTLDEYRQRQEELYAVSVG